MRAYSSIKAGVSAARRSRGWRVVVQNRTEQNRTDQRGWARSQAPVNLVGRHARKHLYRVQNRTEQNRTDTTDRNQRTLNNVTYLAQVIVIT